MITTTASSISYSGNNSTSTQYAIPFPFLEKDDIAVTVTDSSDVATVYVNGTDFTVTTNKDSNGRITSGNLTTTVAVVATSTVAIERNTDRTQSLDLIETGALSAEALETALDRQTMIMQEIGRDSSLDVTTDLDTGGTGIVAQTASATLAARTISAAAASGISITNGDGVAGNPTIDLDPTTLNTVTTVADSDEIRVETSAGSENITVANLLTRSWPHYKYVDLPMDGFKVSGGSGATISTEGDIVTWTSSHDGTDTVQCNFVVPEDYSSGDITFKIHSYVNAGVSGDPYVIEMSMYDYTGDSNLGISGSVVVTELSHSDTDCRSSVINLGDAVAAGKHYVLFIARDATHASDTTSGSVLMKSVRFQYSADRASSAWT